MVCALVCTLIGDEEERKDFFCNAVISELLLCTIRVIMVLLCPPADVADAYQFPPAISLTQQPKTFGFTQASNILNSKNATDSLGSDCTIKKIPITGDTKAMLPAL